MSSASHDRFGAFLIAYDEYLEGRLAYEDLPRLGVPAADRYRGRDPLPGAAIWSARCQICDRKFINWERSGPIGSWSHIHCEECWEISESARLHGSIASLPRAVARYVR